MLKRLIEVALPLKEVSEQSAREKSIRHGHISTLHIWWARRPLAACRAVVFASLIPDPDDPECPEHFRQLVRVELGDNQFKPKDSNGSTIQDTPRNRCLEFIKYLVKWENSNEPTYIEPARKLIKEAHKIFHPVSDSDIPKVLDPFAGGGAIPLEALRLGCEAHAIELNPVAHLIELCTLVYPQKFGKPLPKDKPIPDYIKRLIAHNRAKGKDKSHATLFEKSAGKDEAETDDLIPDVEITEADYRKNPLAADVKYWGHWVLAHARKELEQFYPSDEDGPVPVAYLWARTVKCSNPACGATIPLIRQTWLCNRSNRKIAAKMIVENETGRCRFEIVSGNSIDFDPKVATFHQGSALCPLCQQTVSANYLRSSASTHSFGLQPIAVVITKDGIRSYRTFSDNDKVGFEEAKQYLSSVDQADIIPKEKIPLTELRRLSTPLYGLDTFRSLFNDRQLAALSVFEQKVKQISGILGKFGNSSYSQAIRTFLAMAIDRLADRNSSLCRWIPQTQAIGYTFSRQALGMVWDYVEVRPDVYEAAWSGAVAGIKKVIEHLCSIEMPSGNVTRNSAMNLPFANDVYDAVLTDPPYYDSIPYSHLADFFYVWMRKTCGDIYPNEFRTPLTPKTNEMVQDRAHSRSPSVKTKDHYEREFAKAMVEINRIMNDNGIGIMVFAHKETAAWEILIKAILRAGLQVTATWPLHTERPGRLLAHEMAALASSISLVFQCRNSTLKGFWDNVRQELSEVANERLDFFWNQGVRGADFFISAIGPALSVFGKYEQVKRLSGEEVTVGQFLDEVRSLVTGYALNKIIKSSQTGTIDPETRFYVVWKWSYGDAKVPADEAFKMAQALGLDTEMMWDRTGTLEKSGQNVQTMSIAKRMSISNLGEPQADGSPGSIVDVLHRMCSYRDKGDTVALTEFLARSGHGRSENLWLVAQAISEILPDGDKEKQLLQGLLNQRDGIMEAARDAKLF